jgi:hypothetical protein
MFLALHLPVFLFAVRAAPLRCRTPVAAQGSLG